MRKIAVCILSALLLGLWGCAKPELTMKQRKTIEYLEALAGQKEDEADRTESLGQMQIERAAKLRQEAEEYRRKARLVVKGQDIDELERAMMKQR